MELTKRMALREELRSEKGNVKDMRQTDRARETHTIRDTHLIDVTLMEGSRDKENDVVNHVRVSTREEEERRRNVIKP